MYIGIVKKIESVFDVSFLYFPSKVGGLPRWLSLENVPTLSDVLCNVCGSRTVMLLQLYAAIEELASCFHRTIYIFCCRNWKCYLSRDKSPFIVLRCNLPQVNKYYGEYPFDPEAEDTVVSRAEEEALTKWKVSLCNLCGFRMDLQTNGTRTHHECSSLEEQSTRKVKRRAYKTPKNKLFLEFELELDDVYDEEPEVDENERLKRELKILRELESKTFAKNSCRYDSDIDSIVKQLRLMNKSSKSTDKYFDSFSAEMRKHPDQVIRYNRGGKPLLISDKSVPSTNDIPNCAHCGSKLTFEFQVTPQLLYNLKMNFSRDMVSGGKIDWGTLIVYTCPNSCSPGGVGTYVREFLWKQDITYLPID